MSAMNYDQLVTVIREAQKVNINTTISFTTICNFDLHNMYRHM